MNRKISLLLVVLMGLTLSACASKPTKTEPAQQDTTNVSSNSERKNVELMVTRWITMWFILNTTAQRLMSVQTSF